MNIYKKLIKKVLLFLWITSYSLIGMPATYFISNNGNNLNSGQTSDLPWQTLEKVNATTFKEGDQILFQRGNIFYGSLLIRQSGVSGNPIVFGAYGTGLKPIITGFTNVSEWSNKGNNIWESTNTVSALPGCNMVSINDLNTPMGRYPKSDAVNGGYLTYQSHSGGNSITSSYLTNEINWTGAEVVVRTENWILAKSKVISQTEKTITFSNIGISKNNNGFFFQNDIRCCTQQNDWYYNSATKKISIYSITQPTNVKVSTLDRNIQINAKYINISDLELTGANVDAVYAQGNDSYINITNTAVKYVGVCAFNMNTSNVTLNADTVLHSQVGAIDLAYGSNAIVTNNYIKDMGLYPGMRAGKDHGDFGALQVGEWNTALVQYNTIINTAYNGINFYGQNIQIKNNLIDTFCILLDDGGGIYTFSGGSRVPMKGCKIIGNICINGLGTPYGVESRSGAAGIYLDEKSKNVEVCNNSIADTYKYGIQCNLNAGYMNFHDNTVYNGSMHQFFASYSSNSDAPTNNIIRKNIFVAKFSGISGSDYQKCLSFGFDAKNGVSGAHVFIAAHYLDSNYYARPITDTKVIQSNSASMSLAEWQNFSGKDIHSHKSCQTVTKVNDIQFLYNETKMDKTIILSQPMIDVKGAKYEDSLTLSPYTSVVLLKDYHPETSSSEEREQLVPRIKCLPNLFSSSTTFKFSVDETAKVTLEIFDMLGKRVTEVIKKSYDPGNYSVEWDGTNINGQRIRKGMYIYAFRAGEFISSQKLLIE